MKFIYSVIMSLVFVATPVWGQILDPSDWKTKVEKISDTEYNLIISAKLNPGWHLYSQDIEPGGPIPTEFSFTNTNNDFELVGSVEEPQLEPVFDKVFNMDIKYFDKKAVFKQKVKILNPSTKNIKGNVNFMLCDDTRCLAPTDEELFFSLDGNKKDNSAAAITLTEKDKRLSNKLKLDIKGSEVYTLEDIKSKSSFTIFILGFLGGLIALLTPCVFPMIPLTVSFFTKGSENPKKGLFNSVMYGVFIFLIYVLLSIPFHLLDSVDPEILNNISTNVVLNIIFFVIFIAFAFSFFGYFELTLPSSWSNALDSKANSLGGLIGVSFMALTLAIVSFSCTGPILGTLLGGSLSADSGAIQLSMGMSGFGLALALPFSLFAMFPKWLNKLPKSGGWMTTVKVMLGFIELALALKFLSNADLVMHWGLLKRELFIGLWILIGVLMILYLFGIIKFPHDGPVKKFGLGRITTIVLIAAFVIYLIPGLSNTKSANLTLLSGFPPPMFYSFYEKDSDCPLNLSCYKDLDEGIAAAKELNKPIMLDFTGWACVNCRKMEEQVWSQSKVYDILQSEFVIISLYVDDKRDLPESEQFIYKKPNGTYKNVKSIGDKYATLQTVSFQNNSQPFYVLLSPDLEMLNTTTAYTPDVDTYYDWLVKGVENFKKTQEK